MAYMDWQDDYAVGVGLIDAEHRYLFDLVNDYHAKSSQGGELASIDTAQVLNKLVDYTQSHFLHEEALMRLHAYPGLAQHQMAHDHLVTTLFELHTRFSSDPVALAAEIQPFLSQWLRQHIMREDRAIGDFLHQKGVQG